MYAEKKAAAAAKSDSSVCSKHSGQPISTFCLTCSKSLCGVCTLQLATKAKHEHIGHDMKPLAEAREVVNGELEAKLGQVLT